MDASKIVVMWRGDRNAPGAPTRYGERLASVIDALRYAGFSPEPLVYFDADIDGARRRLKDAAGVLVWINPLADGEDRTQVDAILRDAAHAGAWVSAHPDVIAKMGVKTVLYATRSLGWGSDTDHYTLLSAFDDRFPAAIARGPRVLKPHRGNDGRNVLKVAQAPAGYRVQHAFDDSEAQLDFASLRERIAPHFANGGTVVDQAFHRASGMVRCYMSGARVIGFGEQTLRRESGGGFAMASSKAMAGADNALRADLRAAMEADWTPGLLRLLGLSADDLPVLWDADFLLTAEGYRLCEINVSCVSPFPDAAPRAIAAAVLQRLR